MITIVGRVDLQVVLVLEQRRVELHKFRMHASLGSDIRAHLGAEAIIYKERLLFAMKLFSKRKVILVVPDILLLRLFYIVNL